MYSIHHFIKKILFKNNCIICNTKNEIICQKCINNLPFNIQTINKAKYTWINIFPYHHKNIKKIIWELKYKNNTTLRKVIFREIFKKIKLDFRNKVYIISVPKSKKDGLKERDFDHGLLLAKELKENVKDNIVDIILLKDILIKDSPRQVEQKDRISRLNLIRNNIKLNKNLNINKIYGTLIIIDDVVTTGSTRDEMVRILSKIFLGKIIFISIAH
jgi:predicted amidophosphoribosyltransferase